MIACNGFANAQVNQLREKDDGVNALLLVCFIYPG